MKLISDKKFQSNKNNYLFGSSSAIITNLGLIAGLYSTNNAKLNILGSILLIAIADNISDTLGIHIYQEAEGLKAKKVWFSSFTNFSSRLIVSSFFCFPDYIFAAAISIDLLDDTRLTAHINNKLFYRNP